MWNHLRILLLLGGVLSGAAMAVDVTDGPRIEAASTSAIVRWTTDVASGSSVVYGLAPDRLTQRRTTPGVGTAHAVELDGLRPGTRYFVSVGTARKTLKEGQFATPANEAKSPPPGPKADAGPSGSGAARSDTGAAATPAARPNAKVPPASTTWANPDTLRDHFERHGRDFASKNPDDYAAKAWLFLQRAKKEALPAKLDPDGVLRVWDPRSGSFAAYTPAGTTKTFFKPHSLGYFDRQPGRLVKLNAAPAPE